MTDDVHTYRTEPDPAFADRLERELLGRLASPSNSTDQDLPEDVQFVRLVDPDRPPAAPPRSHTGRWLAAAAVLVLVVAAVALLRIVGDGEDPDGPVDVVPTTTTAPPWTDTPSTGSIVTADGHGWPEGATALRRPDDRYEDFYVWDDFDPATGSFLYVSWLFGSRIWVVSEDGDEEASILCPLTDCYGAAFGPGPDEVTAVVHDDEHAPVVPERLQIIAWDGTVRDSMDISSAFTPDADGTAERSLAALAWSPDGSRLAIGTEPGEGCDLSGGECAAEVWIFDRDGGDPQLVHTADPADPTDGQDREPPALADLAWSPDGRSLAVSVVTPPLGQPTWPQLVALRFEPGEPVRADVLHVHDDVVAAGTQLDPDQYDRFAFAWSPDGARIAVAGAGSVAEISAYDGRVLARHPGAGGDGLAWLPD